MIIARDWETLCVVSCRCSLAPVPPHQHCGSPGSQSTYGVLVVSTDILSPDIHHNFPGVNGQVCVVERPIELLLRDRLVSGVVVWGEVWVSESLLRSYTLLGVKDQHVL